MADKEALTPRVFIVRHGETEWAKTGRQTGKTDLELTPLGIKQVLTTASHLVGPGRLLDPTRLSHVFVSPRKRAQQTFRCLFGDYLYGLDEVIITTTEDIAEWDYGDYEGLTLPEINSRRSKEGLNPEDKAWNVWRDGCEGGEVKEQVTERVDRVVSAIKDIQRQGMMGGLADIVVVAHGAILRAFVMRWLGYPLDMPLNMMLAPGAVGILSYKNNSVDEPAFHVGFALPAPN